MTKMLHLQSQNTDLEVSASKIKFEIVNSE